MSDLIFKIDAILAEREKADRDKAAASKSTSSDGSAGVQGKMSTKLPKLQIKPFSGDFLKWREFWDSFEVSVHLNPSLSPIEKFQYLKSFLRNEALSLVEGYSLSDATYDTTVAALKERFNQPELCINLHLDQMIYMKECQNNVVKMQSAFDLCEAHIRGLVCLGMAEAAFERVFAPLMLSKFPRFVRIDLNRKNGLGKAWTLANLRQFLKEEIAARKLGSLTVGNSSEKPAEFSGRSKNDGKKWKSGAGNGTAAGLIGSGKGKKPTTNSGTPPHPCTYCHLENHRSEDCNKFPTASQRRAALGRDQCLICLRKNHKASQCRSSLACKYCGVAKSHHHSLCFKKFGTNSRSDDANGLNADAEPFIPAGSLVAPTASDQQPTRGCAILGTAIATVIGANRKLKVRVVLDSCATRSFARLDLLKQLGARKIGDEHLGLAGLAARKRQYDKFGCYEVKLVCLDGEEIPVAVNGLENITCPIDRQPFSAERYPILKKFSLADPPQKQPGTLQLDLLIGLDHYYRFVGHIAVRLSETLVLLETKLGYVMNGSTKETSSHQPNTTALLSFDGPSDDQALNKNLERLWEMEDIGVVDVKLNADEIAAVEMFEKEISYDPQAKRYSVRWPWKTNRQQLPDNYGLAMGRLKSLLRRLDPGTLTVYHDTIMDQLKKGIIEKAPRIPSGEEVHYVPHHCVVRPDRTTTKVRIVYDASAKSSKDSPSLNDCIFPGPVILADLCGLILRFRQLGIGITSDIEKAFLQVRLKPIDRDATRFIWIKDTSRGALADNIVVFRFTSVPFGVTASPYMLAGTIKHHLTQLGTPVARQILSNSYVDNVITSVDTTSEAVAYYNEAKKLFNSASMNLREWHSNDKKLMICVDDGDKGRDTTTSVLGIKWNTDSDLIHCSAKSIHDGILCSSKRLLLQAIASLFDPCGLLSPVTIIGKIMMQELWLAKFDWDDKLPGDLQEKANNVILNLQIAVTIHIPRHVGFSVGNDIQLHCFVDASKLAYAAVIYQRSEASIHRVNTMHIFAKTKVAPSKKPLTIHKLELSAMVLGCSILQFVADQLGYSQIGLYLWSDSTCSIRWVSGNKQRPVFVKNRVDKIRAVPRIQIGYVPTEENPADLPTRGVSAETLKECELWWHGPKWLRLENHQWPQFPTSAEKMDLEDEDTTVPIASNDVDLPLDLIKFSSLDRAIVVMAWMMRFISGAKGNPIPKSNYVTAVERTKSLHLLIKTTQLKFANDRPEDYQNVLRQLDIFVDPYGLLRCKGRVEHSNLPFESCCPFFVPKKSPLAMLIIRNLHERMGHAGVQHTLSELNSRFWIPQARQNIKSVMVHCGVCKRWKGGPYRTPKPPPLPAFQVSDKPSFTTVGLDYAGPLQIRQRDGEIQKVWICIFTCCSTRAVHLEVVPDMSTSQFLSCLRRFIAHRNTPTMIVSDNAKQFQLAAKTVQDLWTQVLSDPSVQDFSAAQGIEWKFIVEFAPWMGGMYERMVGLTKRALKCMLQNKLVDLIELQTLGAEVSAILNSRPLTYCEDQLGYLPLTPNDLQSRHRSVIPTTEMDTEDKDFLPSGMDSRTSLILHWKRLESRLNEFWKIWQKDYLSSLNNRKWRPNNRGTVVQTPKVGTVVMIGDRNLPRGQWLMGRIKTVHLSPSDQQIRSVAVQTASGKIYRRPLSLIYPLEIDEEKRDESRDHQASTLETPKQEASASTNVISPVKRPTRKAAADARQKIRVQQIEADEEAL